MFLKENIKKLINEELGAFDKQYQMADKIAKIVKNSPYTQEIVDLTEFGVEEIKYSKVNITKNFIGKTKASFLGITDDYGAILSICFNNQSTIEEISAAISHELMHSLITATKYAKNLEFDDTPDYYCNLIKILRSEKGFIYDIAYALYATYYQECNSFVSQTTSDLNYLQDILKDRIITMDNNTKLKFLLRRIKHSQK